MSQLTVVPKWQNTPKKIDPNWDGSLFQSLGLEKELCPTCDAHLKKDVNGELICLNGCHLIPEDAVPGFWKAWIAFTEGARLEDLIRKKQEGETDEHSSL